MFDFNGKVSSSGRVDLSGRGRKGARTAEESRSDFVKRQHQEREARERKRIREAAAKKIQAVYRGHRCRRLQGAEKRQVFDKRYADISKVSGVLPPPQKAKFVFHALVPMLRLFALFFRRDQDADRLSAIAELVRFSGVQADGCNIFRILLVEDEAPKDVTQKGVLALLEKLFAALLLCKRHAEATKLLQALQQVLFSPGPEYKPLGAKSGLVVAQLLRRTGIVQVLPPLCEKEPLQAVDIVQLLCCGIESVSLGTVEASLRGRQELLVQLLSTPGLVDSLCQEAAPSTALRRLCTLLVHTAGVLGGPHTERCQAEVLDNVAAMLERFALQHDDSGNLLSLLTWLSWAKERMGDDAKSSAAVSRLHRGGFVRMLLAAIGRARDDVLLAVCRLYFAPSSGMAEAEVDPPLEVLQTLAFATPLAERLFPTFQNLMRNCSVEAVFDALQPPALASSTAIRLRVFCSVYAVQLQPMYDYEFFGDANPLRLEEVRELLPFLNRLAYHFVTWMPDQASLLPAAKALRTSLTALLNLLYHRHRRKPILESDSAWIIPESRTLLRRAPNSMNLGSAAQPEEEDEEEEDDPMEVDEGRQEARERSAPAGSATSSQSLAEKALQAVLAEMPHVLPFEDRVSILHNAILADQEERRAFRGPWGPSAMEKHQIRRNFLVEDGIASFEGLEDEHGLRDTFRVEFIAPDGTPESGVDGGGLFKEFMVHICREMFDPEFGLFSATSDHALYPSTSAFAKFPQAADLYTFLGKVVGKAIYEMFLLEPQFSRVFLNRLLGRINEVDDIAALDRELHRNMLQIKECEDVAALGITFSISVTEKGVHKDIDLIPNGSNTIVTRENLTRYLHLMANYRTNVQFQRHTLAFLNGMQKVIPVTWLKMFDPYELNTLISGSTTGFDVKDLRANTVLSGGYQDDSPCVRWLWRLLQEDLEPEDMGRFLMFTTSCSRAPLLGFQNLNPKFCVHRVPDSERLPTSATCANLLKLPDYVSYESLKTKVLQAIRAEAGFDLS
ncbi:unnamed protein product [Effrenium voratum]|uniref:HECT-type E3 ubiquitin transferase n=1 Tax=Effrenium voratum TaxID=2562239 RepID=A0AA36NAA4_9DINO|nr:unnamed protein product [Effrenium voratum]